jgi:catechol 2,3-dioxygenase-like lactoylglutathione lyase family enzyme
MPLNHVELAVRDLGRSAAFYAEHFGLTRTLHHDQHRLILGSEDGAVLAARERFRAAGLEETEWQDDGRFVRVQVADPDGYRVEVYAF